MTTRRNTTFRAAPLAAPSGAPFDSRTMHIAHGTPARVSMPHVAPAGTHRLRRAPAIALLVSLAACGGGSNGGSTGAPAVAATSPAPSTAPAPGDAATNAPAPGAAASGAPAAGASTPTGPAAATPGAIPPASNAPAPAPATPTLAPVTPEPTPAPVTPEPGTPAPAAPAPVTPSPAPGTPAQGPSDAPAGTLSLNSLVTALTTGTAVELTPAEGTRSDNVATYRQAGPVPSDPYPGLFVDMTLRTASTLSPIGYGICCSTSIGIQYEASGSAITLGGSAHWSLGGGRSVSHDEFSGAPLVIAGPVVTLGQSAEWKSATGTATVGFALADVPGQPARFSVCRRINQSSVCTDHEKSDGALVRVYQSGPGSTPVAWSADEPHPGNLLVCAQTGGRVLPSTGQSVAWPSFMRTARYVDETSTVEWIADQSADGLPDQTPMAPLVRDTTVDGLRTLVRGIDGAQPGDSSVQIRDRRIVAFRQVAADGTDLRCIENPAGFTNEDPLTHPIP